MFSLGCCDQIAVRKTIKYAGIYVFRTSKERKRSLGNEAMPQELAASRTSAPKWR